VLFNRSSKTATIRINALNRKFQTTYISIEHYKDQVNRKQTHVNILKTYDWYIELVNMYIDNTFKLKDKPTGAMCVREFHLSSKMLNHTASLQVTVKTKSDNLDFSVTNMNVLFALKSFLIEIACLLYCFNSTT